jgi:hypothetical protein
MTLMDGYTRVRLTPEIAGRPGAGGPDDWESVSASMAPSFFLAVSAARRAAHTGHEVDGITAGGVHETSGRRNPCTVPWTCTMPISAQAWFGVR